MLCTMNLCLINAVIHPTWAVVKLKPEKNSGLNRIRTHDLCDTEIKTAQVVCITALINHKFIPFSAVQIYRYDLSYIHLYPSTSTGIFWTHNVTSSQMAWYTVAQLVEHCTSIAEVMGLNHVQAWIFFSGFNFITAQVVSTCITALINHKFISFSAVEIKLSSFI